VEIGHRVADLEHRPGFDTSVGVESGLLFAATAARPDVGATVIQQPILEALAA